MKIKLKSFNLTKREYFRLISALQKHKLKIFIRIIYCLLAAILIFLFWGALHGIFLTLLNIWYPLVILLIVWILFIIYGQAIFLALSKMNRHQFQSYDYAVEDNFLVMNRSDGAVSKIPIETFVKSYFILGHYILQENLFSAHIIPESSFDSDDNVKAFEKQLENFRKI